MITYVVDADCLEVFTERLQRLSAAVRREVRFVEYSELAGPEWEGSGPFLFTGVSLMTGRRLELAQRLEKTLGHVLNRPSKVQPRLEALQRLGLRIDAVGQLPNPRFPLTVRFDAPAGYVEGQAVHNPQPLHDLVAAMIMACYEPSRIWAAETLTADRSALHFGGIGGLDVCRVEYAGERVWRIDDGPMALLPGRGEEEAFLAFVQALGPVP